MHMKLTNVIIFTKISYRIIYFADIDLKLTKIVDSSAMLTDRHIMRDEEIRISCKSSFTDRNSRPSPFFDYLLFNGNTDVQMRILRTYWTSQGNVVPGNDTSNTSSYVLINAPKHGFIPPHRCNIVCDFYSTRYNHTIVNSSMELSFSTDQVEVLCKYILSILSVT